MKKEQKYSRPQRKEMAKLNEKFDSLLAIYYCDGPKYSPKAKEKLIHELNEAWVKFCSIHNAKKNTLMNADPAALMRQIESGRKLSQELCRASLIEWEGKKYTEWLSKMDQHYPVLLKRMKFTNSVRNLFKKGNTDHVKEKFQELKGKSPKGTWL